MKYQLENFAGCYEFRCGFHSGWKIENHLHEYSEILYCKKGSVDILINGEIINLPEKHLIWIPPNYVHQYIQTDAELICAVFSNDFIPLFFRITKGKQIIPNPVNFSDMSNLIDKIHTLDSKNLLLINGILNIICAKILEKVEIKEGTQADGILYQKVITYISNHFKEDISLKLIAKKYGYNEKYLSHSIHQLTGIHFSKLLAMYRIEYTKNLLTTEPSSTISEIALKSGFSAINTFNRTFKEFTNMTPTEYRTNYFK